MHVYHIVSFRLGIFVPWLFDASTCNNNDRNLKHHIMRYTAIFKKFQTIIWPANTPQITAQHGAPLLLALTYMYFQVK